MINELEHLKLGLFSVGNKIHRIVTLHRLCHCQKRYSYDDTWH